MKWGWRGNSYSSTLDPPNETARILWQSAPSRVVTRSGDASFVVGSMLAKSAMFKSVAIGIPARPVCHRGQVGVGRGKYWVAEAMLASIIQIQRQLLI